MLRLAKMSLINTVVEGVWVSGHMTV